MCLSEGGQRWLRGTSQAACLLHGLVFHSVAPLIPPTSMLAVWVRTATHRTLGECPLMRYHLSIAGKILAFAPSLTSPFPSHGLPGHGPASEREVAWARGAYGMGWAQGLEGGKAGDLGMGRGDGMFVWQHVWVGQWDSHGPGANGTADWIWDHLGAVKTYHYLGAWPQQTEP